MKWRTLQACSLWHSIKKGMFSVLGKLDLCKLGRGGILPPLGYAPEELGILRKICDFLHKKQLKNLYIAFIKPFTEYGVLAWARITKDRESRENKIREKPSINKAVIIMLFNRKFESAQSLFFHQYINTLLLHLNINLSFYSSQTSWKNWFLVSSQIPHHKSIYLYLSHTVHL